MYHWSSNHTDYSYFYFVKEHNLEFLTILFWLLIAAGIAQFFIKAKVKT